MNNKEYNYTYIAGSTTGSTAVIFTGRGVLHAVTKNNASGSTGDHIRICNNATTTSTATLVGFISQGVAPGDYTYDAVLSNGLTVNVGTTVDCTVTWMKG